MIWPRFGFKRAADRSRRSIAWMGVAIIGHLALCSDEARAQSLLSQPVLVNDYGISDTSGDFDPDVATDGGGVWISVWYTEDLTAGDPGNVFASSSFDAGANWTTPLAINTRAATLSQVDSSPRVATDEAGLWVVAFESKDSLGGAIGTERDILFVRSTNDGLTWTLPLILNPDAASDGLEDFDPSIATDGAGNWITVWERLTADSDIVFSRSSDNAASWSPVSPLHSNAPTDIGDDLSPRIATAGNGTWIAVWQSDEDLGMALGTDFDIFFARSTDNGSTWSPPQALLPHFETDGVNVSRPNVTTDGAGNWVAIWKRQISGPRIQIAYSSDDGLSWQGPTAVSFSSTGGNIPIVVTDRTGVWVASWASGTPSLDGRIVLSVDAGVTWSAPSSIFPTAPVGTSSRLAWATDRLGQWVVIVSSERDFTGATGGDFDVFAAGGNGDIVVDPDDRISFLQVLGRPAAPAFVAVANVGSMPLTFGGSGPEIIGPDAANFSFVSPPDASPLLPGAMRQIEIAFSAAAPPQKEASLQILSNDADEPQVLIRLVGYVAPFTGSRRWRQYK